MVCTQVLERRWWACLWLLTGTQALLPGLIVRRGGHRALSLVVPGAVDQIAEPAVRQFSPAVPAEAVGEIQEQAARAMFQQLAAADLAVPTSVASSGRATASFYASPAIQGDRPPAVVCLHGFDSSCLEWRRLVPLLEEAAVADIFALDVHGWGFVGHSPDSGTEFSAVAKREHLKAFVDQVVGTDRPVVLMGASLGGALAIEFAAAYPDTVAKTVLIDPQGFVDGAGPAASLPRFLARLGVRVLGSPQLRSMANQMAYSDKETFATEDAMKIGRLHVLCEGWEDANLEYMCSGGFQPSLKVPEVKCQTLVLWGRDDEILDPALYAERFLEEVPNSRLQFVDNCGHVPHLEQPKVTASHIVDFLR
uniref:AB hydrolase-1 domain-containing protein n=1 Tax=Rhizochromulina marina TaxID=1034831 RepID=A0A7S2SHF8_9STRA|mmetsp:Transcript_30300/g.88229  ORF Transcript_30300/g.88229 Transcript_30300/m.88229 type:complete len:365 (+) Transcript_30300:114-1208(+)